VGLSCFSVRERLSLKGPPTKDIFIMNWH
jgi:hypothetical protein